MSDQFPGGIIAWLDAMVGGAATALISAVTMRLIYHTQEVRKHRRPFFGIELLFEPPVAVGMAILGDSLGDWLGLSHAATIGVIGVLAWIGPRGAQELLDRWVKGKMGEK